MDPKKKSTRLMKLLQPGFRLYFLVLLAFPVVTMALFFESWPLAVCELVVVLIIYIYFSHAEKRRKKAIVEYINTLTHNLDQASHNTFLNFPMPMTVVRIDNEEIIWANQEWSEIAGGGERVFQQKIGDVVENFDVDWIMNGKTECPRPVVVGQRVYKATASLVRTENDASAMLLATIYWIDITELSMLKQAYSSERPVVAIIMLDSYEEIMKYSADSIKSSILALVDSKIHQWAEQANGILRKYDRDKVLFIFNRKYLDEFIKNKFDILDKIKDITNQEQVPVTLSIGIGKDGENYKENHRYAQLALDMALSRGGDQAVIRNSYNFEFYGGRSKELEKRTKVKTRIMANALGELVSDSSQVYVMGHKAADIDSIGAAVGIVCAVRKKGKNAKIVLNQQINNARALCKRLVDQEIYKDVFISPEEAFLSVDGETLVVVVDTNRPDYVESRQLLDAANRVAVIDHHRRAADYIEKSAINLHEIYASSACEMVAELLQYLVEPSDILKIEAEALLAGIVLDTRSFSVKSGVRTFEAAAFLRRCGADTIEIKTLFQNDFESYIRRFEIIKNSRAYRDNISIAFMEHSDRITAAQAADEMLNISGTQASFVVISQGGVIYISARSLGTINVQTVLERLGGGGHITTAGAQITDKALPQVLVDLERAIDQEFDKPE